MNPAPMGLGQLKIVHSFNDSFDPCTTGTQRALSLRLGPQVQALLSREGPRRRGRLTGHSCGGNARAIVGGSSVETQAAAKTPDEPALEGGEHARLHPTHADAAQSRRELSEAHAGQ